MKERLRDKTRDELTLALNALSITCHAMAERVSDRRRRSRILGSNRSQGIIDVQEGPIRWVNCLKRDGSQYSPPQWWTVFGIPDERPFSEQRAVKVKTVRSKSFPLFGKVVDVTWQGEDYATRLISFLANDPAIKSFVKKTGDVEIESHAGEFQGWTVQVNGKFSPTQQSWDIVQKIADSLLSSPQP